MSNSPAKNSTNSNLSATALSKSSTRKKLRKPFKGHREHRKRINRQNLNPSSIRRPFSLTRKTLISWMRLYENSRRTKMMYETTIYDVICR